MNWAAVGITFGLVVLQAIFAWRSGVLTRSRGRKITMPFLYHGGMYSDAFILPWVIGLAVDHMSSRFAPWSWLFVGTGTAIFTLFLHAAWGANPRTRYEEHMWTRSHHNHSILDLNAAGLTHMIFMAGTLTIMIMFFSSSPPHLNLWIVAVLLTLHWPLAVLLPGWVKSGRWFDPVTILATAGLTSTTWCIVLAKLYT